MFFGDEDSVDQIGILLSDVQQFFFPGSVIIGCCCFNQVTRAVQFMPFRQIGPFLFRADNCIPGIQVSIRLLSPSDQFDQAKTDAANAYEDAKNAAEAIRVMKEKVSEETGIPAKMLTFDDEEACRQQAATIKEYATPRYPSVQDGGDPHPPTQKATRDQFAEWLDQVSKN